MPHIIKVSSFCQQRKEEEMEKWTVFLGGGGEGYVIPVLSQLEKQGQVFYGLQDWW